MIPVSSDFWASNGLAILFLKTLWPFLLLAILFPIAEALVQEKMVRYFLRKNRIEFFALLSAMLGYLISYIFVSSPATSFWLSIIVTFVATLVIVYSKTREKDFYFVPLRSPADREDWMGEGTFQYERVYGTYAITNSYSG